MKHIMFSVYSDKLTLPQKEKIAVAHSGIVKLLVIDYTGNNCTASRSKEFFIYSTGSMLNTFSQLLFQGCRAQRETREEQAPPLPIRRSPRLRRDRRPRLSVLLTRLGAYHLPLGKYHAAHSGISHLRNKYIIRLSLRLCLWQIHLPRQRETREAKRLPYNRSSVLS